jgi:Flp pilus assembly protein TadG
VIDSIREVPDGDEPMPMLWNCIKEFGSRMARAGTRLRRYEEGATMVEFALASTVFIGMLLGIMQACLALYSYDFVAEATRSAARYAIVRGYKCVNMPDCDATPTQIQTYVRSLNYPAINTSKLTVNTIWMTATAPPKATWPTQCTGSDSVCKVQGNAVKVTVSYPYQLNVPFINNFTINMSSTSQMVISQ